MITKFDKSKAVGAYTLAVTNGSNFIQGQLELYKDRFINTNDNKYLEVMNNLHGVFKLIKNMDYEVKRLSKQCRILDEENKRLKANG